MKGYLENSCVYVRYKGCDDIDMDKFNRILKNHNIKEEKGSITIDGDYLNDGECRKTILCVHTKRTLKKLLGEGFEIINKK